MRICKNCGQEVHAQQEHDCPRSPFKRTPCPCGREGDIGHPVNGWCMRGVMVGNGQTVRVLSETNDPLPLREQLVSCPCGDQGRPGHPSGWCAGGREAAWRKPAPTGMLADLAMNLPPDPALRDLDEVLEEIRQTFAREGFAGIQGFSITGRTAKASINLKWGETRTKGRKA